MTGMRGRECEDVPLVDEAFQASAACDWNGEFAGIFQEFVAQVRSQWPELARMTKAARAAEAAKLAHRWRGGALSFGLQRFAADMKQLETGALQGRLPEDADLVAWAADLEAAVEATLQRWPQAARFPES